MEAAADDDEGAFDDERLPGDVFGVTGDLDRDGGGMGTGRGMGLGI